MGDLRIVDRRREERAASQLELLVWGVDMRGERFMQRARARDISLSGALLSGLEGDLRSGDVVGILYANRKARYRVIWVRQSGTENKLQAAVHRVDGDECPWQNVLLEAAGSQV